MQEEGFVHLKKQRTGRVDEESNVLVTFSKREKRKAPRANIRIAREIANVLDIKEGDYADIFYKENNKKTIHIKKSNNQETAYKITRTGSKAKKYLVISVVAWYQPSELTKDGFLRCSAIWDIKNKTLIVHII